MAKDTIKTNEQAVPLTAEDALNLWDSGAAVPGFQVEGSPERQQTIYAAAFELIRDHDDHEDLGTWESHQQAGAHPALEKLESREKEVAHSIAYVAMKSGWAKMVSQHVHRDSPAITVSKP